MSEEDKQAKEQHFIEEVGLMFETLGMPRMAGRIFGWLLIAEPPYQSPGELADMLQASKGSISTMTRLLTQLSLIERVALPGQRRDYYCIKPGAWTQMSKARLATITAFRQLAEKGLDILKDDEAERSLRLEEMRDIHAFWEKELPALHDRWEKEWEDKNRKQLEQMEYKLLKSPINLDGFIIK